MRRKTKVKRKPATKPRQTNATLLPGTRYTDLAPKARRILRNIARRTKRQPYIRSAYFNKEKIFFTHFWKHLSQKPPGERARRLRYLPAAIEIIQKSKLVPLQLPFDEL